MNTSGMNGPYSLENELDQLKDSLEDEGVYMFTRTDNGEIKRYIGRTDSQTLYVRLSSHEKKSEYENFCYKAVASLKDRFEEECQLYHYYDNENDNHPGRPEGKDNWVCPDSDCDELD